MKDTFHGWSSVGNMDLTTTVNLIVTGRTPSAATPDSWLFKYLGAEEDKLTVLDFGCGVGRNTYGMAFKCPSWTVVGYDNEAMLAKRDEFYAYHYKVPTPPNVMFNSDWDVVRIQPFGAIFCSLVLQHIYEDALSVYLEDFKKMTKRLMVVGRRINDDPKGRSTWTVLEEHGYKPTLFMDGHEKETMYIAEGHREDHHIAIYQF